MPSHCSKEGCNRYSDIDVYFADGTDTEMCAEHSHKEENVIQGVPRHGSDNVNREIEKASEVRQINLTDEELFNRLFEAMHKDQFSRPLLWGYIQGHREGDPESTSRIRRLLGWDS